MVNDEPVQEYRTVIYNGNR